MKGSGKPDDRKGQVRFDVARAGDGFTVRLVRHRQTKETEQIGFTYEIPRQSSTLPICFGRMLAIYGVLPSRNIIYIIYDSAEKPLAFDFESEGAIFLLIKL